MQVDSPAQLRNVAIVGHKDTGKTTLTLAPDENIVVDHTEVWDQAPQDIVKNLVFFDKDFAPPGF